MSRLFAWPSPLVPLGSDSPVHASCTHAIGYHCAWLRSCIGVAACATNQTYRSAVDDPARFTSSKRVGPWVGPTPSRNQSGERDVSGGITKAGDVNLRRALCQAATVMMNRGRSTWLRTWGAQLAKRRGRKRAMVALARRIAVILHRIWVDGTVFQPDAAPTT
ncbi:transposase, partial [Fluviibacterium sp. DFM31]